MPAYCIESAASALGSCSVSGLTATCDSARWPREAARQVNVIARGTRPATLTAQARVTASNDRLTSNNTRDLPVTRALGHRRGRVGDHRAPPRSRSARRSRCYADVAARCARGGAQCDAVAEPQPAGDAAQHAGRELHGERLSVICTHRRDSAGRDAPAHRAGEHARRRVRCSRAPTSAPRVTVTSPTTPPARTAWVQAERDVELTAGPGGVDLGVGAVYEIPYLVRSRGPQPTGDVALSVSTASSALVVDSHRCRRRDLHAGPTRSPGAASSG